jgi:WD40 repeat protein
VRLLQGPETPVIALAVSPDGRWLGTVHHAASPFTKSVCLWDLHATQADPVATLDGAYLNLAFAPGSDLLALATSDGPIQLVTVPGWQSARHFGARLNGVVFLSPDGLRLHGCGPVFHSHRFMTFALTTSRTLEEFALDLRSPSRLEFAPAWPDMSQDGKLLATMSKSHASPRSGMVAVIWDIERKKAITRFSTRRTRVESVHFSPDARLLATVTPSQVLVWDVESKKRQALIEGPQAFTLTAAFDPEGTSLYIGTSEGLHIYDVATWSLVKSYEWAIGGIMKLAFTPDGLCGIAGGNRGQVVVWDLV